MSNILKKIKNIFYSMKLQRRVFLSYVIIITTFGIVLVSVILSVCLDIMYRQASYSTEQSFHQTISFFSYKIEGIISSMDIICSDELISEILIQDPTGISIIEQSEHMRKILRQLKYYQGSDVYLAKLYIDENLIYSKENKNFGSIQSLNNTIWGKELLDKKQSVILVPSYQITDNDSQEEVLGLARVLKNPYHYSQIIAVLRMDILKSDMIAMIQSANSIKEGLTCLVNENNVVVAVSDTAIAESFGIEDGKAYPYEKQGDVKDTYIHDGDVLILEEQIANQKWRMITLLPKSAMNQEITYVRNWVLLISVLSLAVAYWFTYPISSSITKRIITLSKCMDNAQNGIIEFIENEHYGDEVGTLYNSYNSMVEQIEHLIQEQYDIGQKIKNVEMAALQSQINPHFLYNTLDLLRWLNRKEYRKESESAILALASFYKLSLNKGKSIVPIQDEIKHVEYYMSIQNIRFENQIEFQLDIDEQILSFIIPKITLQPIVENAITHGILEKSSRSGTIIITGYMENHVIVLKVSDDGVGVPSDRLAQILTGKSSKTGSHYGIRNINERIKLLYGEIYGLSFRSICEDPSDMVTTVTITIPAIPASVDTSADTSC